MKSKSLLKRIEPSILVFLLAFIVKEYKIEKGNFVTWDEAHFGKFSQQYLNRSFYFDVHPPLGKMLTALSGWIFGQSETFLFSSSENFPVNFDYVGMRRFHAFISSFTPLFAFNTFIIMGFTIEMSFLYTLLFIFENGFTCICRLILLDSHLLTFTAACTYFLVKLWKNNMKRFKKIKISNNCNFYSNKDSIEKIELKNTILEAQNENSMLVKHNLKHREFKNISHSIEAKNLSDKSSERSKNANEIEKKKSDEKNKRTNNNLKTSPIKEYYTNKLLNSISFDDTLSMALLGISIGCVMSVKWIGCLTMLFIGLFIIYDLLHKLSILELKSYIHYFLKRVLLLILLPAIIYSAFFCLHFKIVNKSGNDNGLVSAKFQMTLKDSPFINSRKYVSYGKMVTIRGRSGYLHSHNHEYPIDLLNEPTTRLEDEHSKNGVPKPLINTKTAEPNKNESSKYQITSYSSKDENNNFYFQKVNDNTESKFVKNGDRIVLLHDQTNAYISIDKNTSYNRKGRRLIGKDGQAIFESIWIIETENNSEFVESISGEFTLRNESTGYFLSSSENSYPSWGYNQGEIYASKEKTSDCHWYIEENLYTDFEELNPVTNYKGLNLLGRFIEYHVLMFNTNKSFVQDPDLEPDKIVSLPYEWPILRRGLRMTQWNENLKFYMMMNPIILYFSTLAVIISPIICFYRIIKIKRKIKEIKMKLEECKNTNSEQEKKEHFSYNKIKFIFHENNLEPIKINSESLNEIIKETKTMKDYKKQMKKIFENEIFLVSFSFIGWGVHYFAFYFVGRVLYLHHYFPALFFSIFSMCYLLNIMNKWIRGFIISFAILAFSLFSPLTYGFFDNKEVEYLKVIPTWDFID